MLKSFPRTAVRLGEGPLKHQQEQCGRYLLQLDADRLLHNFRVNAGLVSTTEPLGGWESPDCGLRGHFTGHYLSACAAMCESTGDERFKQRMQYLVTELAKCQTALGGEYLSAFPATQLDTLEKTFGGAWAPYYTLHKILAGVLDVHRAIGDGDALGIGQGLGNWICSRMARLPSDVLEPLLRTSELNPSNEYGGIGESLYQLHQLTGDSKYLTTAKLFDRSWFLQPLMEQRDVLSGLHANTHIPQAIAAARRYEITGETDYRRAVEYLWERIALARSYVNGGSSGPRPDRRERSEGGEHWPDAFKLHGTLTPRINESCVANNMLRLTDTLFTWSAAAQYADFRERIFLNSVLAMQHPHRVGGYIYSHPLGSSSRKVFGDFDKTFWCCYGTSVEAFSRLSDGTYFHDGDELWVSQFIASEAEWKSKGVRIMQTTDFPYEQRTVLRITAQRPTAFALHLRIPTWANNPRLQLSGSSDESSLANGEFSTIRRTWHDGDQLRLSFPMSLSIEDLPGDDREIAFRYGPTVLAARSPHALELGVEKSRACAAVRPVDLTMLQFTARLGFGDNVPIVPLNEIVDEPFGVYFKTNRSS